MSQPTVPNTASDLFANPGADVDKPPALPDLPPVEAPSAGFVVQLFVIPALVVLVVIIVWLLFGKLAGGERDAMEYVRQLQLPSANWRSAFELASLIQNDQAIASDPKILGELTDLLSRELDHYEDPKLRDDPKLAQYVAHTLGVFQTLEAQTQNGQVVNPLVPLTRAVGPQFDIAIRMAAAGSLAKQAARLDGKLDDPRAIKALGEAAADSDSDLRQLSVYALGFFERSRRHPDPPRSHPFGRRPVRPLQRRHRTHPARATPPPRPPSTRCSPHPTSTRPSRSPPQRKSRTRSRPSSSERSKPSGPPSGTAHPNWPHPSAPNSKSSPSPDWSLSAARPPKPWRTDSPLMSTLFGAGLPTTAVNIVEGRDSQGNRGILRLESRLEPVRQSSPDSA